MYHVKHDSYTGIGSGLEAEGGETHFGTLAEARDAAAGFLIVARKRGCPVHKSHGGGWNIQDDGVMVSDLCGDLAIVAEYTLSVDSHSATVCNPDGEEVWSYDVEREAEWQGKCYREDLEAGQAEWIQEWLDANPDSEEDADRAWDDYLEAQLNQFEPDCEPDCDVQDVDAVCRHLEQLSIIPRGSVMVEANACYA